MFLFVQQRSPVLYTVYFALVLVQLYSNAYRKGKARIVSPPTRSTHRQFLSHSVCYIPTQFPYPTCYHLRTPTLHRPSERPSLCASAPSPPPSITSQVSACLSTTGMRPRPTPWPTAHSQPPTDKSPINPRPNHISTSAYRRHREYGCMQLCDLSAT